MIYILLCLLSKLVSHPGITIVYFEPLDVVHHGILLHSDNGLETHLECFSFTNFVNHGDFVILINRVPNDVRTESVEIVQIDLFGGIEVY